MGKVKYMHGRNSYGMRVPCDGECSVGVNEAAVLVNILSFHLSVFDVINFLHPTK
ncbi:MAG: hypothetical protein MJZ34_16325 [Paludibacteraceae bacterium]|nr:hypothetical protein [Paludibacteraceae bacterium]